jgi:pimeloyl-ACP methyl ester carboxylesterase
VTSSSSTPRAPDGRSRHAPTLRSAWTTVGGLELHARVSAGPPRGRPPLVLVHGMGVSSRYLIPLARRLSTDFAVLAPDLPGHGRSDAPARALTVPEQADALLAWMDRVGLARPALLGNSMGCQVLIDLAARRPERVGPLVLVGPTVDCHHRTFAAQLVRLVMTGLFERPSLVPILALDYARMLRRLPGEIRAALDDRPEAKAPHVRARSLLIRGAHDLLTSPRWILELAARLRSEAVRTVPGVGHAVHYSRPDATAALVREFLLGAGRPAAQPRVRSSRTSMRTASSASSWSVSESSPRGVIS